MSTIIALAGNPNSGKTTLFNALTGSAQYVGNWPGVTIEKKEGRLKGSKDVLIQDLPGVYSLSPYTPEEIITRDFLVQEHPDAIINVVDGTNLERNLYLTTQLLELGIPVVVALNMMDLVKKSGDTIDRERLGRALGCPVVPLSALKGEGGEEVARQAVALAQSKAGMEPPAVFVGSLEHTLAHIEEAIAGAVPQSALRFTAIKLFERDEKAWAEVKLSPDTAKRVKALIAACEKEMKDDAESIVVNQRYSYIASLMDEAVVKKHKGQKMNLSDRIDRVVTNRILALPIFVVVMALVYYIAVTTVGAILTDFTNETLFGEWIVPNLRSAMENANVAPWLTGLTVDGIVGGVGAVLGFVPQMLVLFLMLSILEDVGYMARVAFIMDRIFRRFGLSGKSFIPMMIGSGCSVPGIMASRTIESERDRRMTVITTSFIPCSAKLPIIALFAGALFNESNWVAVSTYFIGVAAVIISGIILKKTRRFSGDPAPFVMELPPYRLPAAQGVLRATWERGWSFIKRAGTIILLSSVVLWFLQAYGVVDGALAAVEDNNNSLLAAIGNFVAPLFAPLGFGNWKAAVATFTGLIAKENVVNTFGVLYGFAEVAEDGMEIWSLIAADYTALTAYSFMLFNLLCVPCFAAIGAIKREMNSAGWTGFALMYQTVFAYVISLIVYQLGIFFTGGAFTFSTILAAALLVGLLYLMFRPQPQAKGQLQSAM
jgi:ferrous iron transport protein B